MHFLSDKYKKSMEEAHNLSVTINNNLKNYDRKLRPNAGGKCSNCMENAL